MSDITVWYVWKWNPSKAPRGGYEILSEHKTRQEAEKASILGTHWVSNLKPPRN